jgi:predicted nuclease of predicted toxin-antitoxin system
LSLKLLVDECILDKVLVSKLREAGHDVRTVAEEDLIRKPDHAIFEAAIAHQRMVITVNCVDFVELSERKLAKNGSHPGVLLVYRYNDPAKEMTHDDIIKAISNLESAKVPLENNCHALNYYQY